MPITYEILREGHFIHAVSSGILTRQDFINYEERHAADKRLKSPAVELLEISFGACKNLLPFDFELILEHRKTLDQAPAPHRCAILVSYGDTQCWDIAEFYSGMVNLHLPESVIVFGDARTARIWLGVEEANLPRQS